MAAEEQTLPFFDRLLFNQVDSFLSKFQVGSLVMRLPGGTVKQYGNPSSGPQAELEVLSPAFFRKAVLGGDVGFGEAYVEGMWSTPDLTALLSLFILNEHVADDRSVILTKASRAFNRVQHLLRSNSLRKAKRNIAYHYDLSNEMFEQFLDPTMSYSSAYFASADQSLEDAQKEKLRTIIRKAEISERDHVLEIGCGWGSFALEAVRQTGCRVTGITLSEEQYREATRRAKEAGMQDHIDVKVLDYRKVEGKFDRIVSIEMFEAVGKKYWGTFFERCDKLLNPKGKVSLQVITIPEPFFDAYLKGCDFIQKHVFPGGALPSLTALLQSVAGHSAFTVHDVENIGLHYAKTLRMWHERFSERWNYIQEKGFSDQFRRLWEYYLCYCEAAFKTRRLNNHQLVMSRPLV